MSYVYIISAPATNSIKIGFSSTHPRNRLRALQTGNSDELALLGWFSATIDEEQKWHRHFGDYCIRGEWFRRDGIVADWVDAFLRLYWPNSRERFVG